ncbi:MAG: hypothetical protein QNL04_12465 [SAR324 cluster bacterium]|nr:hypothetical protein [SAR324 cluster bacterium]
MSQDHSQSHKHSHSHDHSHAQGEHACCESCDCTLQSSLYCSACDRIQQLEENADYFSLFNLPQSFDVDFDALHAFFDELILNLHPDFFEQAAQRDKDLSLAHTALLHQAKDCLENPFERGKYLLGLLKKDAVRLGHPPQEYICKMFDLQEDLDQLQSSGAALEGIKEQVLVYLVNSEDLLTTVFPSLIESPDDLETIDTIEQELAKLKYILTLASRIGELTV